MYLVTTTNTNIKYFVVRELYYIVESTFRVSTKTNPNFAVIFNLSRGKIK